VAVSPGELRGWLLGTGDARRYTQDSPVMPDVWRVFALAPHDPADLLLTPHRESSAAELARALLEAIGDPATAQLAYNRGYVACRLTFEQLVRDVLPLSEWWQHGVWPAGDGDLEAATAGIDVAAQVEQRLQVGREQGRRAVSPGELPGNAVWLVGLVGRIAWEPGSRRTAPPTTREIVAAGWKLLRQARAPSPGVTPLLWGVNRNREVRPAVWRSRVTVKADAAARLFELSCRELRWAVVDSGIDALHPAFWNRPDAPGSTPPAPEDARAEDSRVIASYDFTRLRPLFARKPGDRRLTTPEDRRLAEVGEWLRSGRTVDWGELEPLLRLDYADGAGPPEHEHGTHVAGVIGGDWRRADAAANGRTLDYDVTGICPDIRLYDLRVMGPDGRGDEFAVLAALQFVRWLNLSSTVPVVHGVNLSLAIDHDVGAYACGRTPVCRECERLIATGTVVVAAAGNEGRARFTSEDGVTEAEGYRSVSITDPGNAEGVITVGATHRSEPHAYGVSYFSSRGPTGDGRSKPDLIAPGEKITAPAPGASLKTLDGTSQAAPHVSGAAALLLARYPELIGDPARVKAILCSTATDVGRERSFQGAGVVDALRAIQSV
jgi:serine protease AprX